MAKRKKKTTDSNEKQTEPTPPDQAGDAVDVAIEIIPGHTSRGWTPITIKAGGDVLHTGRVNPHKPETIDAFIDGLFKQCPALKGKGKQAKQQRDDIRHELLQLADPDQQSKGKRRAGPADYEATDTGIVQHIQTADGSIDKLLTNFTATITADVVLDDGAEPSRRYEITATLKGRQYTFTIPTSQFPGMDWTHKHLGAGAIVYPGWGTKDHARAAIQLLSGEPPSKTIYTHTGWRLIGNQWAYLHAGGAIGAGGPVDNVAVELSGALERYKLPEPPEGDALKHAIQASMAMLNLAMDIATFPAYCAIWRAVLGPCDSSTFLAGPTGVQKSELAALVQQHFGPGMDRKNLPAGWNSTDNALVGLLFSAKDTLTVIDDFAPGGSIHDKARLNLRADHVFRAQGNGAGRGRMNADSTLRQPRPPRGSVVATGEDIPRGQSLRARLLVTELSKGDIDLSKLTACQHDARQGLYAAAMAGYVRFIALRYDTIQKSLADDVEQYRARAVGATAHCRTPEAVANFALGLKWFIAYALDAGAIDPSQADSLWARGWGALMAAADRQSQHQRSEEPTRQFIDLLQSAIASGEAHLANRDGGQPLADPEGWGWRGNGSGGRAPMGKRIGWIDDENIYLEPAAAYKAAQMAANGEGVAVALGMLKKHLADKGLIIPDRGRRELTVRRKLEGQTRRVLYLSHGALNTGETDDGDPADGGSGEAMADSNGGFSADPYQNPPFSTDQNHDNRPETGAGGGNGGNGGFSQGDTFQGFSHNQNGNGQAKAKGRRVRVTL